MAYRRKSTRSTSRYSARRSPSRSRSPARRRSTGATRRTASRRSSPTVRVVIEHQAASDIQRPAALMTQADKKEPNKKRSF